MHNISFETRHLSTLLRQHRAFFIPFFLFLFFGLLAQLIYSKAALFLLTNAYHHPVLDEFFKICTFLGDGKTVTAFAACLFLFSYRNGIMATIVLLYTSGVVHVFKQLFGMDRPSKYFEGIGSIYTIPGYEIHVINGFPSGHSTSVFALAAICIYLLPNKKTGWCWLVFLVALLTALSRVYLAQHFFQDIFAGAILGVFLSFQVFYVLNRSDWFHKAAFKRGLF